MAPTQLNAINAQVKMDTSATPTTDVSGFSNSVKVSGGNLAVGKNYVMNQKAPILTVGHPDSYEITYTALYNSGSVSGNQFQNLLLWWAAGSGSPCFISWAPNGLSTGSSGSDLFTSGSAYVSGPPLVSVDTEDEKQIMIETTLVTATITRTTL